MEEDEVSHKYFCSVDRRRSARTTPNTAATTILGIETSAIDTVTQGGREGGRRKRKGGREKGKEGGRGGEREGGRKGRREREMEAIHLAADSCHQKSSRDEANQEPEVVLEGSQLEPLGDVAERSGHQVVFSCKGLQHTYTHRRHS